MKPDSFEDKLCSQPVRTVPPEWRREILARARNDVGGTVQTMTSPARPWLSWLREALWPHPVAWGALASVWILSLALNHASFELNGSYIQASEPSHLERRLVREQREFIAEEFGASALPAIWNVRTPQRTTADGSRTQRRIDILGVAEQCAISSNRKELV